MRTFEVRLSAFDETALNSVLIKRGISDSQSTKGATLTQHNWSSSFSTFVTDVENHGFDATSREWQTFFSRCKSVKFKNREMIFDALSPNHQLVFIASGISAAQHELPDGETRIARFFRASDFCTLSDYLSNANTFNKFNNYMLALTPIDGVMVPMDLWMDEFISGGEVGCYARMKMLKAHLFDIELLKVKTMNRTQNSFAFLNEQQPEIATTVPHKFIAQFLGITAEGFSRFLKSGRVSS